MVELSKDIDPITLELVQLSFVNIVREMRATLIRTSYSPVLYEAHDFSCALLDAKGQLIGLSEDVPSHIFAVVVQTETVLKKFDQKIYQGDIFIMNDPYTGGTHLNDVAVLVPFFFKDKFAAIIAVRAHFTDVGGATPGSLSGKTTEIYQEGIRIPPVKICEKGKTDEGLAEVIFGNMRLAGDREGDFLSMLDTCRTAEVRLNELYTRHGFETIGRCIDAILQRSEKYMRQRISQLPEGVWYYENYVENSGTSDEPMPVRVTMEIKGDTVTFDLTGSSAQVRGPTNYGPAGAPSAAFIAVKSLLDPLSPVNSGSFRPIEIINPEGTFINARLPGACGGTAEARRPVAWAIMALIFQAFPQAAIGATRTGANHTYIAGWIPEKKKDYILYEYYMGGWPGNPDNDGSHCVAPFDTADFSSFRQTETVEREQGILVESSELRIDSEGAGYRRGGLGMTRRLRNLCDRAVLSVLGGDAIIPPFGVAGGYASAGCVWTVIRKGERITPSNVPGKVQGFRLEYGDVLEVKSMGGGGYGDPLDREPELVKQDVLNEYISEEKARQVYGVIIEGSKVNLDETQKVRDTIRKQRIYIRVIASKDDEYDISGLRLCLLSNKLANQLKLTTGDLVEYVSTTGAPLRSWVKVGADLIGEESPLGPRAREILKAHEGDTVEIRALGGLRRQIRVNA